VVVLGRTDDDGDDVYHVDAVWIRGLGCWVPRTAARARSGAWPGGAACSSGMYRPRGR
jgi:hypothetical protein